MSKEPVTIPFICRGRSKDNGVWVQGYLYEHEPPLECIVPEEYVPEQSKWYILRTAFADWNMPRQAEFIEIDPATICAAVYVTSEGKLVFENDVVRYSYDRFLVVGVVKRGMYAHNGSGGEYEGSPCLGVYIDTLRIMCREFKECIDASYDYDCAKWCFPEYMRQQNILDVIGKSEIVGCALDSPYAELMREKEGEKEWQN